MSRLQELIPHQSDDRTFRIDWDAVVARCRSHPAEASLEYYPGTDDDVDDGLQYRALHIAVRWNPPLSAVSAIVEAFPEALHIRTDEGGVLQMACQSGASDDVLRLLLTRQLEDDEQAEEGNPISWMGDVDISTEATEILLGVYPFGAVQVNQVNDYDIGESSSPLVDLIDDFSRDCGLVSASAINTADAETATDVAADVGVGPQHLHINNGAPLKDEASCCDGCCYEECDELEQRWSKLLLFLRAADDGYFCLSSERGYVFRPLHALLRCVVEPDLGLEECGKGGIGAVVRHIMDRHPEDFAVTDCRGRFPLHVLVESKFQNCMYESDAVDVIRLLLKADAGQSASVMVPASAAGDNCGKLPLHLAASNGWPGVMDVFEAAPKAVSTRDVQTNLYPFMAAATSSSRDLSNGDDYDMLQAVNNTFMLLRENPTLVSTAHPAAKDRAPAGIQTPTTNPSLLADLPNFVLKGWMDEKRHEFKRQMSFTHQHNQLKRRRLDFSTEHALCA